MSIAQLFGSTFLKPLGFTSSSCGGLQPPAGVFAAVRPKKKELLILFWLTLGNFLCSVVTSVTFDSYLSNFEKVPKKSKRKFQKILKLQKIRENPKTSQQIWDWDGFRKWVNSQLLWRAKISLYFYIVEMALTRPYPLFVWTP